MCVMIVCVMIVCVCDEDYDDGDDMWVLCGGDGDCVRLCVVMITDQIAASTSTVSSN